MASEADYRDALKQMQALEREQATLFREVAERIEDADLKRLFEDLSREEDEHEAGLRDEESQA